MRHVELILIVVFITRLPTRAICGTKYMTRNCNGKKRERNTTTERQERLESKWMYPLIVWI